MTAKAGYNPNDKTEVDLAMAMYEDLKVLNSKHETYMFICQMHMSSSLDELEGCISSSSAKYSLFL